MLGSDVQKAWFPIVSEFARSKEGLALEKELQKRESEGCKIYPPNPFRALEIIKPEDVKVVILGQDPYHGPAQANGLAFSVRKDVRVPPSLRNIFKEIHREYPEAEFSCGELEGWAKQGVLLLNAVLTVEEGKPGSHATMGWEKLTDEVIRTLAQSKKPIVFMLWGKFAQEKKSIIEKCGENCLILESNHPSPLSATRGPIPFLGNNHFKKANAWLSTRGRKEIDWSKNEP